MSVGMVKQYTWDNYLNNSTVINIGFLATLGITYKEKDPYFQNSEGQQYRKLIFTINNTTVSMGKTDMYEITQPINISSIAFNNGVPESIQVNICGYSKEQEE